MTYEAQIVGWLSHLDRQRAASSLRRLAKQEALDAAYGEIRHKAREMRRRRRRRTRERREELVSHYRTTYGSKCSKCGNETPMSNIDWHHVDPTTKEFVISDYHRGRSSWWEEIAKCVPLCRPCHRREHTLD